MKTGEQSLFHLPTIKSIKATVVMCDLAFKNCNTVTVTQKIVFKNCNTVSCKDCNAKMKSEV